jgi:hypothetical protein
MESGKLRQKGNEKKPRNVDCEEEGVKSEDLQKQTASGARVLL